MWAGAVQACPLSFSKSPFISDCCCFYTVPPYSRNAVFYFVDKYLLNSEMKPPQFFFPCARSEPGFLQVRSWCSNIAEQRMKKQSIRSCCHFLLSSAPRKYAFQPISKVCKRHLIIVIMFKQRLSRDIACFGGLS